MRGGPDYISQIASSPVEQTIASVILSAYGRDAYDRFVLMVDRVHVAGRVRIRRWGGDGWRRPRRQAS